MAAKLFVGNLDYSVTTEDLRDLFSSTEGTMLDCVVVMDKYSGRSRGFGFVEYETDEQAEAAIKKVDGSELKGRNIRVSIARPPREEAGAAPAEEKAEEKTEE